MKTTVKRLGIEDGRIAYEILIRKSHFLEDYTEMVRIQESSNGKRRFYVRFEDFEDKECENYMKFVLANNEFRNNYVRSNQHVTYSSMAFIQVANRCN